MARTTKTTNDEPTTDVTITLDDVQAAMIEAAVEKMIDDAKITIEVRSKIGSNGQVAQINGDPDWYGAHETVTRLSEVLTQLSSKVSR